MTSRISAIALGSVDPTPVAAFWCAALGWDTLESDAPGVVLGAADGSWPTIEIARVPEGTAGRTR